MPDMAVDEALDILLHADDDTSLAALMHAMAVLCQDKTTPWDHIMLGFRFPGIVRETAAIALHVRTKRPEGPNGIILDEADWRDWLSAHAQAVGTQGGASNDQR